MCSFSLIVKRLHFQKVTKVFAEVILQWSSDSLELKQNLCCV